MVGRQPRLLEHLLIRGFAAATIVAMVAAALFLGALLVYVVGTLESHGLLLGRTMIDITAVPETLPKAEQLDAFRERAAQHDVSLALVVPDRAGEPAAVDVYAVRGQVPAPVFWADIEAFPADRIGDASILWTYAVDGSASDVSAFLAALRGAGVVAYEVTPDATVVLGALSLAPGVPALAGAVAVSLVIALAAEATRRAARQRSRRIVGWSRGRILVRESAETTTLLLSGVFVVHLAIAAWMIADGAAAPVWWSAVRVASASILGSVALLVVVQVALTVACSGLSRLRPRFPEVVVGLCASALVFATVSDGFSVLRTTEARAGLEQHLADEAARGDDVVLTTASTSLADEVALGRVGRAAVEQGAACLAQTNLVEGALVTVPACAPRHVVAGSDEVVVLVPTARESSLPALESAVREALADGWELDREAEAPVPPTSAPLPIRIERVASTADFVESVSRWVIWSIAPAPEPLDLPVIVLPSIEALALNRVGLAVRNAELRFAADFPLEDALQHAAVRDVVVQFNRVGAQVEQQLVELRTERALVSSAVIGAVVGLVFAASTMIAAHRVRSRSARRLRTLVGRSAAASHGRFIGVVSSVAALLASSASAVQDGSSVATIACVGTAVGLAAALLLTAGIALSAHRDRITR